MVVAAAAVATEEEGAMEEAAAMEEEAAIEEAATMVAMVAKVMNIIKVGSVTDFQCCGKNLSAVVTERKTDL